MRHVEVWTDGACRGNGSKDSVGGCGVVLLCDDYRKELKSAQYDTTNNKQELEAVLLGLSAITNRTIPVKLFSDSAYVINCFVAKWYVKWKANGWQTAKSTPVKNVPLWIKLIALVDTFDNISFQHVKGHANIGENERCDQLANDAIEELLAHAAIQN
jgi:ribonuclease HI